MININVLEVAKAVGGVLIGDSNAYIKGISIDSRQIESSNLYIPIIGENNDGHDYIEDVVKKNVTCTFVQKDHTRPDYPNVSYIIVDDTVKALQDLAAYYLKTINPYVIAVTGSNGKTSAKDMICAIMSKKYKTAKTLGNHNNEIGVPLSILGFDRDIKCAIIEMGVEHHGDIDLLSSIAKPDVALITSIGSAHIANFNNSKNEIARAKLEIYSNLKINGYMLYNKESKEIEKELKHFYDSSKKVYSFGENGNISLLDDPIYEDGYTKFRCDGIDGEIKINILGKHQATNALGCIGIGIKEGIDPEDIKDALKELKFEKMRSDVFKLGNAIIIDDSYKSNPESVIAILESLSVFKGYKKIACLGDMLDLGRNEVKYHKEIGVLIRKNNYVDALICTGELSMYTADKGQGKWFETKQECVRYLKKYLDKKVVIVVKGSRATKMDEIVNALRGINND